VLPDDPECAGYIKAYAGDQALFFSDFAAAFAKLSRLGVAA
jgi:L-ascorbate peroxidase